MPVDELGAAAVGERDVVLINQRGEYLLDYKATSQVVMDELGLTDIGYGILMQAHTYFIINKQYPNYANLLQDVEKAYLDLVSEGVIKDIRVIKK